MMSTRLMLVRHGQASIEARDYDQLSALGAAQCRALGEYVRRHGGLPARAVQGSLRRHQQSFAAIAEGAGQQPEVRTEPGLDEYDFREVLAAYARLRGGEPALQEALSAGGRAWLKHLRPALNDWAAARLELPEVQRHAVFVARVAQAVRVLAEAGETAIVVTSGGVIGAAVGMALGLADEDAVRLNLVIENSSVTELDVERGRLHLVRFNSVAHLADPALRTLV
jgi:broad specificity phosphatase PhoE